MEREFTDAVAALKYLIEVLEKRGRLPYELMPARNRLGMGPSGKPPKGSPMGECGALRLLRECGKGIVEVEMRFVFT